MSHNKYALSDFRENTTNAILCLSYQKNMVAQ